MPDRRFVAVAVPALLFVVTGLVALALLRHGASQPLGSTLAIGTLSSLVATMIASAWRVVGVVRPQPTSTNPHIAGLIRVQPKNALTPADWMHVLQTAKTEFYVAGHSLGKWCSASNSPEFMSHVRRILDSDGRVILVMLDPLSPQIRRLQLATSVDYTRRIDTSLGVLADLTAGLTATARSRLTIAVLEDHMTLPYMVVGNESRLITATYLGSTDSDDVPCLELERSSGAASAVYDDFRKLAETGTAATLPPAPAGAQQTVESNQRSWRGLFRS